MDSEGLDAEDCAVGSRV